MGKLYRIDLERGGPRVSVVVRRDATRDLYVHVAETDEPTAVVEMSEATTYPITLTD